MRKILSPQVLMTQHKILPINSICSWEWFLKKGIIFIFIEHLNFLYTGVILNFSYDKISALGSQSNEDMIGSLYYPVSSSPFDLTLLPVWFLAVTCIAIGAILSGCEKSGTKFGNNYNRPNYNRNISSDSEVAIVVESDDESDVQQFTTKQVGGIFMKLTQINPQAVGMVVARP